MTAANNPINRLIFKDVRESMRNGGGPACLRLRVVLSDGEASAANDNFILDESKIDKLEDAVKQKRDDEKFKAVPEMKKMLRGLKIPPRWLRPSPAPTASGILP